MNRVAHRFNRAANTYDAHASVQRSLGQRLLSLYGRTNSPRRILELGCGTGLFSEMLWQRFPKSELVCTDIAPNMLKACQGRWRAFCDSQPIRPEVRFGLLNAETPEVESLRALSEPLSEARPEFNLIASNALVQWFPRLEAHLEKLGNLLVRGGDVLFSGFGAENLWELGKSLQRIGKPHVHSPGHSAEAVQAALENQGFILKAFQAEEVRQTYPDTLSLLKSLAGLGATARPGAEPLSPKEIRALAQAYHRHYLAPEGRVTATWSTWAAWAIKP
jgi:malonyl-CoA O-methyltransferase